jgi:hypothetical protein
MRTGLLVPQLLYVASVVIVHVHLFRSPNLLAKKSEDKVDFVIYSALQVLVAGILLFSYWSFLVQDWPSFTADSRIAQADKLSILQNTLFGMCLSLAIPIGTDLLMLGASIFRNSKSKFLHLIPLFINVMVLAIGSNVIQELSGLRN